MEKETDVVVIGGGIGGLTAAACLAYDGVDVTILEASNEWGGCAGKFQRGPYLFPVGATLGMGFEQGGIHAQLLQRLNIDVKVRPLADVMHIVTMNDTYTFHQNRAKHVVALCEKFPQWAEQLTAFYAETAAIAAAVKQLTGDMPVLPLTSLLDALQLLPSVRLSTFRLVPYVTMTMKQLIAKHRLTAAKEWIHLLDAQLIDSMQTTTDDCAAIIGAYALHVYYDGAFYVDGGLYEVAEQLVQTVTRYQGVALKRQRVTSVVKEGERFVVTTKNSEFRAKSVISNVPIQNVAELYPPALTKRATRKLSAPQWGTCTLYLAVKEEAITNEALFYQVLMSERGEMAEGEHIFISVSAPDDRLRAPQGYRTMTMSTHTALDRWRDYDAYKAAVSERMLQAAERVFPTLRSYIVEQIIGAPYAWQRFTGRLDGAVGGLPQTLAHALFNSVSHRSNVAGFYLCGDTIFPGAGTIGVSVSGYHCYQSARNYILR